ncbi:transposase [Streptomyces sp. NPDC048479]|uniref:transposase n=1 Tax=Streptomyces sp. NPDC048479 TaxID=3154725 RepID=UPI0034476AF4
MTTAQLALAQLALAQLPKKYRRERQTLIRTDSGGGTHEFVAWPARRGRWLSYSVGMTITEQIHHAVLKVPGPAWRAATEPGAEIRDGAWAAELDGDVVKGRPQGMRLIVSKERPHPGAQLRFTDADGLRPTCFATNTTHAAIATASNCATASGQEPRTALEEPNATGLRNLPLHDTAQNQIWLEIVQLALDLLAWMPMPALTGWARLWEPRRLRIPSVLRRRPARHHSPPPAPEIRDALDLDQRDHRRDRTTAGPCEPRLTSSHNPPLRPEPARRSRGTRRHPTRQSGH